jgi:hypothetical protein
MLDDANKIEISSKKTESEADQDETEFLPYGFKGSRYTFSAKLLARCLRKSSEAASNELGGKAETERKVTSSLGSFSGYEISG